MIECNVVIDDTLARKALLKSTMLDVVLNHLLYHGLLFFVIWVVIATVDTMHDQGTLIGQHGAGLLLVFGAAVLFDSVRWYKNTRPRFKGGSYRLRANADGLTATLPGQLAPWYEFVYYREYADYLLVAKTRKRQLILPKTEETAAVLQVIRETIPKR